MKSNKLIMGIVSVALAVLGGVFAFFNIFDFTLGKDAVAVEDFFGFFSEGESLKAQKILYALSDKEYAPAFKTIAGVLAIIVLVVAVAYLLLLLLDKKGTNFASLRKILSIAQAVLGILIAICLVVYVASNTVTDTIAISCSFMPALCLTLCPVLAGVLGFATDSDSKKSKKKK